MSDDIRYVLEAALSAPSVQNCQPWRWEARGQTLRLFKVSDRDCAVVDYAVPEAQLVAFGAAVENAVLAASARGLAAEIVWFPVSSDDTLVAEIRLHSDSSVREDPLAAAIFSRASNRRPYTREPLAHSARRALESEGGAALSLIEDTAAIARVARAAAAYDELVWSNENAHYFLYSHMNWSDEEEMRRGTGHNLASLEVGASRLLFGLFSTWPRARVGVRFGTHRYAGTRMTRLYRAAGAWGAIRARDTSPAAYLNAGRRAERVWLAATLLGLSLQPVTGTFFCALAAESPRGGGFDEREAARLLEARRVLEDAFGGGPLAFAFRVGRSAPPSGRSVRLPFDMVVSV